MAKGFSRLAPVCSKIVLCVLVADIFLTQAYAQDPLSRFLDSVFKPETTMPQQTPGFEHEMDAPFNEGQFQSETVPHTAPVPTIPLPPSSRVSKSINSVPFGAVNSAEKPSRFSKPPMSARAMPPFPPMRPAGIGVDLNNSSHDQAPVKPLKPAASNDVQRISIPSNASDAVAVVSAYLNSIHTLRSRFLQTGADGRQVGGTLYVQRPGRMRFAYDPPSTLEIVADGKSVAVRDAKLRTNDVYSIGQTPLKFLLQNNVNLARDVKVQYVEIDPRGIIELTLEDSSTLGGTSTVTLRFDARSNVLREWMIIDPQGYQTTVTLSNVEVLKR